jgi:hypothetical protein
MIEERVQVVDTKPMQPSKGSAGLRTQLAGQAVTVSNMAAASGGIGRGKLVERDTK